MPKKGLLDLWQLIALLFVLIGFALLMSIQLSSQNSIQANLEISQRESGTVSGAGAPAQQEQVETWELHENLLYLIKIQT